MYFSSRALMESALLLLIRSTALGRPCPPAGFEEAGLTTFAIMFGSSISTRTHQLNYRNLDSGPIHLLLRYQGPENACILVGERDASSCCSKSLLLVVDPATATVGLGLGPV